MSSYHLAVEALLSKLLLIAAQTVVVGVLQHKVPGADGLLTAVAGEAVLMPAVALVLHLLGAWLRQREKRVIGTVITKSGTAEFPYVLIKSSPCSSQYSAVTGIIHIQLQLMTVC